MLNGRARSLGRMAAWMVMGASLFLLVVGFWPLENRTSSLSFPAEAVSQEPSESLPVLGSARTLRLEWPPLIRMEDSGLIRLSFEPASGGGPTTAAPSGEPGSLSPAGSTLDVHRAAHTLVEARLEMTGVEANPTGMASAPLPNDQGVSFTWTIHPSKAGSYRGRVWLYLRSIPLSGDTGSERALAALPINVQAVSLLGLGAGPVRILGVAGMLVGLILGSLFLKRVPE